MFQRCDRIARPYDARRKRHKYRFAALSFKIIETLPRGNAELSDQLRRASISVPLNIAEGAGKTSDRERSRYHAIARGSAMECAALMDLLAPDAAPGPVHGVPVSVKDLVDVAGMPTRGGSTWCRSSSRTSSRSLARSEVVSAR